jgi:hypothetical protein
MFWGVRGLSERSEPVVGELSEGQHAADWGGGAMPDESNGMGQSMVV